MGTFYISTYKVPNLFEEITNWGEKKKLIYRNFHDFSEVFATDVCEKALPKCSASTLCIAPSFSNSSETISSGFECL